MDISLIKKYLLISIAALLVRKGQCINEVKSNYSISLLDPNWSKHQSEKSCDNKYSIKLDPIYNAALDDIIEITIDKNYINKYDTIKVDYQKKRSLGCNFTIENKEDFLYNRLYAVALGNGKIVIASRETTLKHAYRSDKIHNIMIIDTIHHDIKELPKTENLTFVHQLILPYENSFDVVYLNKETSTYWRARYSDDGKEESPINVMPSTYNYKKYPLIMPKKYDPTLGYYHVLIENNATSNEIEPQHKMSILKLDSNFAIVKKHELGPYRGYEKITYSADLEGLIVCTEQPLLAPIKCLSFDSDLKLFNEMYLPREHYMYDMKVEKLSGNNNMLLFYMRQISSVETLYGVQLANENGIIGKSLETTFPYEFNYLNTYNTRNGSHCIVSGKAWNCSAMKICIGLTKNV